ncbi:MAG TPA: hypothetical protein VMT87_02525 [Vicinamibacteria bacterium]|nr:hypothetical protein [Vicinamibacteria bacterium]
MALTVTRISLGDAETERALETALQELGVPLGEDWTASITISSAAGAWEMVLDGAPRLKAEHIDWEIVQRDGRARYRKLFQGKAEQSVSHIKRCARRLFWERIHFQENPIRTVNPRLSEGFEEAVWSVLRYAEMNPLHVRFGVWREGFDGMKFVCKVEYAAVPCPTKQLPWSWWSSLVRTPEDLALELQKALVARQKRQVAATAAAARARLRAARRTIAPAPVEPVAPVAPGLPAPAPVLSQSASA